MAKSVAVPADVFVLAAVTARFLEFALEMGLVVVLLGTLHHHGVPSSFVLLPVLMGLLLVTTLGLALPVAAVSVFFRDLEHALPPALMMLMWISPVFYPASFVPPGLAAVYGVNPVAVLLTMFHQTLYDGQWPGAGQVALATGVAVLTYALGQSLFRHLRGLFPEIV